MTKSNLPFEHLTRTESSTVKGITKASSALCGSQSMNPRTELEWEPVLESVLSDLQIDGSPELTVVFIDSRFSRHLDDILENIQSRINSCHLIGCVGQSVIGSGVEAEDYPAMSIMTLSLPDATLIPCAIDGEEAADHAIQALAKESCTTILMFADPFTSDVESLLTKIHTYIPQVPVLGGLASSHEGNNGIGLFLDTTVHRHGAVLMGLRNVSVHTIVAQGAEPIGRPMTITESDRNVIKKLGSRPALDVLRETIQQLDKATGQRAINNLLVGLAMDEYKHEHGRGDFLIRNILGADEETGAIAISANVHAGQSLQYQFRDSAAADADLRDHLEQYSKKIQENETVLGSILCSCNGRGKGLFGKPNHDVQSLTDIIGSKPTVGLFCNGEIGPVSQKNFVHGFTASIAIFTQ